MYCMLEGGGHLSAFLQGLIILLCFCTENCALGTECLFSPVNLCTISCKLIFQREGDNWAIKKTR